MVNRQPYTALNDMINLRAELVQRAAEYVADVKRDHERGHRAHYCEHGVNQWVDYDPISVYCQQAHTHLTPEGRFLASRAALVRTRHCPSRISAANRRHPSLYMSEIMTT